MIDYSRSDVIEALEYLLSPVCTETQFDYCDEIRAAIAWLKEQEARVMTLEELDDYRKTEEGADPYITSEKTPVMVEYSNDVPYNSRWLTIESLNSWLDYRDMRFIYGKEWRVWSARPTEEQRKAVKWDD